MKKIISLLLMLSICVLCVSCGTKNESTKNKIANDTEADLENSKVESKITENASQTTESAASAESSTGNNTLVVYFSVTGNTKSIAESIADGLQADIYEIVPKEPYTEADLDYNDNNSRSTLEMNDSSARPEISGTIENFEQYNTIFLGYPIWWGEAPRILDTFVESYDFTGKTIIPFCTSASSVIGSSADTLKNLAESGNWLEGKRFNGGVSKDKVMEWANQF